MAPWTVDHQAPLSMEFSRQEYCNGLLFPSPGVLPNPRIEPMSLKSPALVGGFFTIRATWEALEGIMLSEISQTQIDKYYMIALICGIKIV